MLETTIKTPRTTAPAITRQESLKLAALHALDILDTPPEAAYDNITQLAAEYFQVDAAVIAFGDETRVWIKSFWGDAVREIPRANSIFELVLAENGPVTICDLRRDPRFHGERLRFRWHSMVLVAEGIETRERYQMLKQMGCQCGQGYYIANPMPRRTSVPG